MKRYDSYKPSDALWLKSIPSHWNTDKINAHFRERREKVSDKDFPPLSVAKIGVVPQLEDAAKTDNGENRKLVKSGDFVVNFKENLTDEDKIKVKSAIKAFVRTYDFLVTLLPSGSVEMEKLHTFLRFLVLKLPKLPKEDWTEGLIEAVTYSAYRSQKQAEQSILLENENGEVAPVPTGTARGGIDEPDLVGIDEVVDEFNQTFGNINWQKEDAVRRQVTELADAVRKDQTVINSSRNGDTETATQDIEDSIRANIGTLSSGYNEFFVQFYPHEFYNILK